MTVHIPTRRPTRRPTRHVRRENLCVNRREVRQKCHIFGKLSRCRSRSPRRRAGMLSNNRNSGFDNEIVLCFMIYNKINNHAIQLRCQCLTSRSKVIVPDYLNKNHFNNITLEALNGFVKKHRNQGFFSP